MRKADILLGILVLLMMIKFAYAQGCAPNTAGCAPNPYGCISSTDCANAECITSYTTCDNAASSTCNTEVTTCSTTCAACVEGCSAAYESCVPECEAEHQTCENTASSTFKAAEATCITKADSLQKTITESGVYGAGVGCGEINSCLKKVPVGKFQSFTRLSCQGIKKDQYSKILKEYGNSHKAAIEGNSPMTSSEFQQAALETKYEFQDPEKLAEFIRGCQGACDQNALNQFATEQSRTVLANQDVRAAMTAAKIELPWWKQSLVMLEVLKKLPEVQAASALYGAYSFASGIFDGSADEDPVQNNYYTQNMQSAQSDIAVASAASKTSSLGNSYWTNCPDHPELECAGKPICVVDTKDKASQCLAALPGGEVTSVTFSSLHVIDHRQNNMFTLKGAENQGVVYRQDGNVNIDKGGTTKISVAGPGASVTDANSNQLYIGRGTTTYLGIGSESPGTYLTNTFIFNPKSSVAVAAVNPSEQQKLRESRAININRDEKLSLTFDKQKLSLYMNAVDISGFAVNYLLLTRGFSNIKLVERDKSFPLASRNNAKGDSLIVKNKGVAISKGYNVNDGTYDYIIKTTGFSTKVFAENGKILEDSSPMSNEVSPRQQILLYKNTFT